MTTGSQQQGLVFEVRDRPAPQGSLRSLGKGRMVSMSPHLKTWREAVKAAAVQASLGVPGFVAWDEALSVEVTFTLARPASHYGTGRNASAVKVSAPGWPTKTPDVDKLIRGCFDAITASGVWRDDALVVEVVGRKVWVDGGVDALGVPGCVVRIRPAQTHE